ncbi:MAG: hypothetical protein K6F71_00955 [Ruminococcus sp.]|uniref:hypothetical protein n=1 Tax=Ruminococcus sp. TaxID=41978 RepID=UPI0025EB58C3|nr:hypothetical protein [Ruminococcus sp.]MCR5539394.1 hypothetical protein [Ruminococcus sp.]
MKKKKIIIGVCVVCLVLVRIFTPYLGRPFLIKCYNEDDERSERGYYLSNKVRSMYFTGADDPSIKFVRYCSGLEDIMVSDSFLSDIPLDINDISNPNLKRIGILTEAVNWSSLNRCTDVDDLGIRADNLNMFEDISGLKKLESLWLYINEADSLSKLNEFQNLKRLEIHSQSDIHFEELSNLENLETLYLSSGGKITGFDKLDSVVELRIYSDQVTEDELCGMDSLERVTVYHDKLSEKVESALREKGVIVNYRD